MEPVARVVATEAALSLIDLLQAKHGPLMFHQSGGCCDGSSPMCYPRGEFLLGDQDVLLGAIGGQPFYIGAAQYEYWKHTQIIIDVVAGRGGMFSLRSGRCSFSIAGAAVFRRGMGRVVGRARRCGGEIHAAYIFLPADNLDTTRSSEFLGSGPGRPSGMGITGVSVSSRFKARPQIDKNPSAVVSPCRR